MPRPHASTAAPARRAAGPAWLTGWGLPAMLGAPPAERDFEWTARQAQSQAPGRLVRGRLRARGANQVRALLRRRQLVPVSVVPAPPVRCRPIRGRDVVLLTRQLATLLGAGIALQQALQIVRDGLAHPALAELITQLLTDIEAGLPLSSALRKHPQVFASVYVHLVEAGEASGQLDVLLQRLATDLEKSQALVSRLRSALTYPAVVLSVAVLVVAFLMVAVVPSFESAFAAFGGTLPAATRAVLWLSRGLAAHGPWLLLAALALAVVVLRQWRRSEPLRRQVERAVLALPVVGPLLHLAAVARWSRTLAGLLAAGLPLVDAMAAAQGAAGYHRYADASAQLRAELARGSSLHAAMADGGLFSPMVLRMCAIGEESGALDHMLAKVAEAHERELDDRLASVSSLFEPVIIVLLGGLVGTLVVALYLPVFQMGQIV